MCVISRLQFVLGGDELVRGKLCLFYRVPEYDVCNGVC